MKKRNCRKAQFEKEQHDQAVKLRKMTDAQLLYYIVCEKDEAYERGLKTSDKVDDTLDRCFGQQAVNDFISAIKPGSGIGQATIFKLQKFAEANGFIPKREGKTNE